MQTLKTAVVVVLLLVVFYGVYEVLNRPPDDPPPSIVELEDQGDIGPPDINFGLASEKGISNPVVSLPEPPAASGSPGTSPVPPNSAMSAANAPSAPAVAPSISFPPLPDEGNSQTAIPSPTTGPAADTHVPVASSPAVDSSAKKASNSVGLVADPNVLHNPYVTQDASDVSPSTPAPSNANSSLGKEAYKRALRSARSAIQSGKYHDALHLLSMFYKSQDLTPDQQKELLDLLDPLAARVIYSREHLVEAPYKVRRNETLMDIANHFNVPWPLLQKINGIDNPQVLLPGRELKVVSGPFRADVDLQTRELTVFLGELYAGRFPIAIGSDPAPIEGEYRVRDKRLDRPYFTKEGREIPPASPRNPFGHVWLDLGKEICIHGSPPGGSDLPQGCISLSPRDADDVFGILSLGSRVRILR